MSNNYFAGMPSINIPRSRWSTSYNVTGTFKHGALVPIDAIPILPGDSMTLQIKDLTRMQTPIAPIFGNIKQHFVAFFVPMRLVWEHTEEFFGANKTNAGYQTTTYELPYAKFGKCEVGSLSHYLGKPIKAVSETDSDGKAYYVANVLKERCYYLCWNEYFRAQQITNPALIYRSDSDDTSWNYVKVANFGGAGIDPGQTSTSIFNVAKNFDVFTACTISPQYGSAVTLPLGLAAPVVATSANVPGNLTGTAIKFESGSPSLIGNAYSIGATSTGSGVGVADSSYDSGSGVYPVNLWANLENATAAKVNDVRYAFAVQKYLERANFAGNYFFGILQVHYGVTSPDARLQRPEFLGSFEEDILVHQVVSTADTTNSGVTTSVGSTGAMSVTASGAINLFSKAFVEPGYVIILRYCRHRQVYSQGIMKEDYLKDRFEIYTPELCNLGDDFVRTRELYWKAGETDIFGYQEHWYQYRYRPDRVTGYLDPQGGTGAEPFWTLANNFTSKPQLNDTFILENRSSLDRALVTGSAKDEYLSDTWINIVWTREMPVRTIPGLIDHFGAM